MLPGTALACPGSRLLLGHVSRKAKRYRRKVRINRFYQVNFAHARKLENWKSLR